MKYYPTHKSVEQLIQEIGFIPSVPLGWVKSVLPYSKKANKSGDRLHGFTHMGYIDIHYDKCLSDTGQHQTRAFHQFVKVQMDLCRELDRPPTTINLNTAEVVQINEALCSDDSASVFVNLIINLIKRDHDGN